MHTYVWVSGGKKMLSFSENFAYAINKWSPWQILGTVRRLMVINQICLYQLPVSSTSPTNPKKFESV